MKNPLIRRIPRELRSDWHKYLVIIVFMVVMIGVISGMYVGHDSMLASVYSGWDELNLEDGSFELSGKADPELLADIASVSVTLYENFYRDEPEDNTGDGIEDAVIRVFKSDSEIDKASFNEGRAPENPSEIAIDRMHADNVNVKIGDSIKVGSKKFTVVGLLSYVNYLTLHQSNTDMMFDAFGFDVAMVTPEAFEELEARTHYSYAWKFDKNPKDKVEEADFSADFLKALITQTLVYDNEIKDYLPEYLRQATNFAVSDIEGDSSATGILCYILIGVIAFIFAITISNTIDKEASVIGTLRASGYSRSELVVHYMSMPLIVTLIGALIGNILGYTAFKNVAVNLYYQSYSLPSCSLVWSNTAIVKTTVIPLILMFFINLFVIVNKLRISPLRFLRHDLTKSKRTKARRLPKWSFLGRFRLRILFQNMPNYVVLIFGVVLIELMMCFAFGLNDSLDHYSEVAPDLMFAEYQYMLMDYRDSDGNTIETVEPSAEAFDMKELLYPKQKSSFRTGMGSGGDESVTVYGIRSDSAYITLSKDLKEGEVLISSAFKKKFDIKNGDTVRLSEEYENKSYEFKAAGTVDYDGGIAVFMGRDAFKDAFDGKEEEFSGFLSHKEITDIDEDDIAMVITAEDVRKVTNQLKHSIGGIVNVFKYALTVLAAALIYLLAKIIIERNEHSISMSKILGFKNGEIGSLYIIPTAVVVVICSCIGFVAGYILMNWVFKIFMKQMDGYFAFYMTPLSMALSVIFLLVGYAVVSAIDYIRIKHIRLDVALKNIE